MTPQEIINQPWTKTKKIENLILLGLTRTEIAKLVTNGNYGFVQNVYAKMREQGRLNILATTNFIPTEFNRRFGVEFEAYNVDMQTLKNKLTAAGIETVVEGYNHSTRAHWKIVTDGSLQGNNTFELVSPILEGQNGIDQINIVTRVLNECGAKVNKTCGTHIHFDASGLTLENWKNIFINYAKLENVIDGFMPESRRGDNNNYCKGFSNIPNFETKINNCNTLQQIETVFNRNRYFKINPTSYSRHNTIEFRQHSGTVEGIKICNWIKFLHNLVEFSKANKTENNIECLAKFNQPELVNYLKQRTLKLAA